MDINELLMSIKQNTSELTAILADLYCIVNGSVIPLEELQNMGCNEYAN